MRQLLSFFLLTSAACGLLSPPATAQERLGYELTPYAAYRIDGDFEDDETGGTEDVAFVDIGCCHPGSEVDEEEEK